MDEKIQCVLVSNDKRILNVLMFVLTTKKLFCHNWQIANDGVISTEKLHKTYFLHYKECKTSYLHMKIQRDPECRERVGIDYSWNQQNPDWIYTVAIVLLQIYKHS